jgi:ABC-2 type transport system ATP-binding protein
MFSVEARGINKFFGKNHAVKDLTLSIEAGEIYGFLGPNGSGKTTSMRMLCGLLTPDSGSLACLGYDVLKQSQLVKPLVGYMTQSFSYWNDLSVRENLEFVGRVYNVPKLRSSVDETLEKIGLTARQKDLAGTLSGGLKQRLALAACMLHKPKLLLLDEPTAGVDPASRREFWQELKTIAAGAVSILVSTHYMDEAERCDKLCYIAYGSLLAQGSKQTIIEENSLDPDISFEELYIYLMGKL